MELKHYRTDIGCGMAQGDGEGLLPSESDAVTAVRVLSSRKFANVVETETCLGEHWRALAAVGCVGAGRSMSGVRKCFSPDSEFAAQCAIHMHSVRMRLANYLRTTVQLNYHSGQDLRSWISSQLYCLGDKHSSSSLLQN